MAEIAPPPTSSMEVDGANVAPAAASEPPNPVDDYACETLYIQNLNEKIKPDGALLMFWDDQLAF